MTYDIHLDDKYGQMNLVDIPAELAAHEPWFNQTLTTVNDSVVRLGIIEGDFHWHKHDGEDEFFLVLEGKLLIDFEDRETRGADAPPGLHGAAGRRAPHTRARGAPPSSWWSQRESTRRATKCFALRSRKPHPRPAGDVTFRRSSRR